MSHQYATLEDTVYFYFGSNDTGGSGGDGATPLFDVREAGAAASAIPLLSGTPTLLTHANYPAGCYEVAVEAKASNGFAADDVFGVFCTLAIDSQNPTGFVGSCKLSPVPADAVKISGDSTAADNLELQYDTTGYTDPTAPASRSQVDGIGAGVGGSVNIQATEDNTGGAIIDSVTFVGSVQGATTFVNTEAEDGVLHDIDDDTDDIDIVYGFAVGAGRSGTSATFKGFVQGNSDEMKIKVYDHVGADWEIIGTISGTNGTTNSNIESQLLLKHTGTGSEAGKVYIRLETDSTTPSNLSVDQLLVAAVTNESGIANGSTVTLSSSAANTNYIGNNWNLALGSQAVSGIYVEGATVSGTGTGSGTTFVDCTIAAGASIPAGTYIRCKFVGTSGSPVTESGTGQYIFMACASAVAGSGTPYFNFSGAGGAVGINNRGWTGGADWTLDSNCTLSHEVLAGGGTTITTGGGDAEIRGVCRSLTVTMSAAETVQFVGTTGPIALSGTTTATVNLYGVSSAVTDTTSAATVTNRTISREWIETDTQSLPGQESPSNTPTYKQMWSLLYKILRNKKTNDGTTTKFFADNESTVDMKQTTSQAGSTVTKTEIESGP